MQDNLPASAETGARGEPISATVEFLPSGALLVRGPVRAKVLECLHELATVYDEPKRLLYADISAQSPRDETALLVQVKLLPAGSVSEVVMADELVHEGTGAPVRDEATGAPILQPVARPDVAALRLRVIPATIGRVEDTPAFGPGYDAAGPVPSRTWWKTIYRDGAPHQYHWLSLPTPYAADRLIAEVTRVEEIGDPTDYLIVSRLNLLSMEYLAEEAAEKRAAFKGFEPGVYFGGLPRTPPPPAPRDHLTGIYTIEAPTRRMALDLADDLLALEPGSFIRWQDLVIRRNSARLSFQIRPLPPAAYADVEHDEEGGAAPEPQPADPGARQLLAGATVRVEAPSREAALEYVERLQATQDGPTGAVALAPGPEGVLDVYFTAQEPGSRSTCTVLDPRSIAATAAAPAPDAFFNAWTPAPPSALDPEAGRRAVEEIRRFQAAPTPAEPGLLDGLAVHHAGAGTREKTVEVIRQHQQRHPEPTRAYVAPVDPDDDRVLAYLLVPLGRGEGHDSCVISVDRLHDPSIEARAATRRLLPRRHLPLD
jgi:hypothetical protein